MGDASPLFIYLAPGIKVPAFLSDGLFYPLDRSPAVKVLVPDTLNDAFFPLG